NDTATTEIYTVGNTLSLHDALPICAKIEVPTIDGRALVRIPPGTNSGKTLRLREKGVPSARNGARGDQYVEIQVVVPQPTDERVRTLMKDLEKVAPEDPRKDLFSKAGV